MDDFHGLLAKDFGFISQQGKSSIPLSSTTSKSNLNSIQDDGFSLFGDPSKYTNSNMTTPLSSSSYNFDINSKNVKSSSTLPVFDKPVYDDEKEVVDIFDGIPGLKTSSSVKLDNVFSSTTKDNASYDDLLGNLGKVEPQLKSSSVRVGGNRKKWAEEDKFFSAFDDLLPGFGRSSPPKNRTTSGTSRPQQLNTTSSVIDNPFVVLESASIPGYASSRLSTESLEQIDKPSQSRSTAVNVSSTQGELFDDADPIIRDAKSKPLFSSSMNDREKDETRLRTSPHRTHNSTGNQSAGEHFIKEPENVTQKKVQVNRFRESQPRFDTPSVSSESHDGFRSTTTSSNIHSHMGMSPKSEDNFEEADGVWLTVLEVTLTTLPTSAPPPSRPPPPRPKQILKEVKGSAFYGKSKKTNEFSSLHHSTQSKWSHQTVPNSVRSSGLSSTDEFEDLTIGRPHGTADEDDTVISNGVSAAFMKEAMDRAEAKLKHAKEIRERENAAKNSGGHQERDEKSMQDVQKQDPGEKHESLDHKQGQKERDEKDRAQRNIENEREQAWEIEREREKGRLAVDRAMKEVRERAAAEARQKAERAAVDKVNAGARERAGRAAVQRVQNEVHERAATEAREREEKASSEAKERKNAEDKMMADAVARAEVEARIRADRVSVNRATAEARERAAAAAAAAAAATRGKQQTSANNFDPFDLSARPGSTSRKASGTSSSIRKASSTTNIVDDLTSRFEATPLSGDFREVGGESDERQRASNLRTQERTEKALADKNERDRRTLWEQEERQRMAGTLDFEIKRWSAGKEGNLRALLSTLQYVLWPECGWQPVSLTDLITAASAKKVYRKAALCIHPDKVQQRGANLQQKYIAEKVFDLLQEAAKKLNSEEFF